MRTRTARLALLACWGPAGAARVIEQIAPASSSLGSLAIGHALTASNCSQAAAHDDPPASGCQPSTSGRGAITPWTPPRAPAHLLTSGFAASGVLKGRELAAAHAADVRWRGFSSGSGREAPPDSAPGPPAGTGGGGQAHSSPGDAQPGAHPSPSSPGGPITEDVDYVGPLASTHKLLKRVSIANTAIALVAAPLIVTYADVSYVTRVGLATSLALFGVLTTGALHWITHPYVHELKFDAATQSFEARMTTLLGRARVERFKLSDVQPLPWNRPVATFMAKGKFYYIDVYSFPNEELLKRLTPSDVPEGYKDDKDDD